MDVESFITTGPGYNPQNIFIHILQFINICQCLCQKQMLPLVRQVKNIQFWQALNFLANALAYYSQMSFIRLVLGIKMLQYFRQDQVKNKDPKLFPFITGCKNLFIYYLFLNVSIINVAIVYKPTVSVWVKKNMGKPRVFIRNITKHQRFSEYCQNR
jgi:hypothetical protein